MSKKRINKVVRNREDLSDFLNKCHEDYDGEVWIGDFAPKPKKRKVTQNNLFHLWLTAWVKSECGGYDKNYAEVVKMELKKMFLPMIEVKGMNKLHKIPQHTSDLTDEEFTHFLKQVEQFFAVEYSFIVPQKDDKYFEEFYQAYRVKT